MSQHGRPVFPKPGVIALSALHQPFGADCALQHHRHENLQLMFNSDPLGCRGPTSAWQTQCLLDTLKTTNPCAWQIAAPAIARVC